jgi:BatD DUF11 like domain
MRIKGYILTLVGAILTLGATGQDISITADYPETVNVGQQFTITWKVNTGDGQFNAPAFTGFYKLVGPQTSYSSSTQIINGKITSESSYSYTYYIQALKEGKYVLGPAKLTLRNKTFISDSLRIEVVGAAAARPTNPAQGGENEVENEELQGNANSIFLRLNLSRKDVYIGEPILATVKIYTRVDLSGINEIKYPDFQGFLKLDLETPPLNSLKRENINGTIYGTGVVQQFLLYPQITGDISIDPVQLTVLVQQKSGQSDPFFGDFFSSVTTIPKAVISQPVKIKVNQLPGIQPDDYSGIVGKAELSASLSKDTVNVNDAVSLRLVIRGNGNLKLAATPVIKMPADVEVYDPKITEDLKNGVNGTTGQKIFEYLLIPRHFGEYKIPRVSFSYFNINSGKYERVSTPELHFYAKKGNEQNAGITVYGGISKENVQYLGKDIRFIQTTPGVLKKAGNLISSKNIFYSLYLLALILFLTVLFIRREHIRRNSDLTSVRNRKAAKVAGKRLNAASLCLTEGATDRFYEEITRAIWGYISDKLNIPVSDLTRENAVSSLLGNGIGEEEITNLNTILDKCEFVRFAPSSSETEASRIYDDASRFIRNVENTIG